MNRAEFIKELEYLLQDLPGEEKDDALQYYRDYLEEAGDEHEAQAMADFGSPERIAAMIRADIQGTMELGGEFTERGYDDERFRQPDFQLMKRTQPKESQKEVQEETKKEEQRSFEKTERSQEQGEGTGAPQSNGRWKKKIYPTSTKVVIGCLLILCLPLIFSLGAAVLAMVAAILLGAGGLLIGLLVTVVVVPVAFLLSGGICVGVGISRLALIPADGCLTMGVGGIFFGLGILGICLVVLVVGKFLPWLVRWVSQGVRYMVHKVKGVFS